MRIGYKVMFNSFSHLFKVQRVAYLESCLAATENKFYLWCLQNVLFT